MNTPQSSRAYDSAALSGAPAGDEQRERAIHLRTDAYAYDVITDNEFERRLGHLGLSATPSAIDAVVADLAGATLRPSAPPGKFAMATVAGRITGFMSETRRRGPWHVPQHLSVRAIMCDMTIDLRYAAIKPGCRIEVRVIMSEVRVRVRKLGR